MLLIVVGLVEDTFNNQDLIYAVDKSKALFMVKDMKRLSLDQRHIMETKLSMY